MKKFRPLLGFLLFVPLYSVVCDGFSYAQPSRKNIDVVKPPTQGKIRKLNAAVRGSATKNPWIYANWAESDVAFRLAQNEIDAFSSQPQNVQRESYLKYAEAAKESPQDPLLAFKWAYASYVLGRQDVRNLAPNLAASRGSWIDLSVYASDAISNLYSIEHDSYLFNRLKFILGAINNPQGEDKSSLYDLGARLLRRNPKDYEVMRWHFDVLDGSKSEDRSRRIYYVRQLQSKFPNDVEVYFLYGNAYAGAFFENKNEAYKKEALWAYNQCLSRLPEEAPSRKSVLSYIRLVESDGKSSNVK